MNPRISGPALPTNDLRRHNQPLEEDLSAALERVRASGRYILGEEVAAFEAEFARYCGTTHCVAVANGTDALELALRAAGVRPGDRVAAVANAGMYASAAILAVGARPAFVDVDPDTLLMSPRALRAPGLGPVRAVVATHLYGRLAAADELLDAAAALGAPLIEDCAQAHGARRKGRRAGAFGLAGCFSFYPTKNLGALGDAGAVTTSDAGLAERLRSLRQYGWSRKYVSGIEGGRNSRLDELQAAVLRAKLPRLDSWNERRRAIAARYAETLSHPEVRLGPAHRECSAAHLFVVRSSRRDSLRTHLEELGVSAEAHYPVPDSRQRALAGSGPFPALPETERACAEVLSLPCFPEMSDAEVARVAEAVNSWRP